MSDVKNAVGTSFNFVSPPLVATASREITPPPSPQKSIGEAGVLENAELEGDRREGDPDAQIFKRKKPKSKKKPRKAK